MIEPDFDFIAQSLGLGALIKEPQLLESGLFSQVWRIGATQSYIVKLIAAQSPRIDSDYDTAERAAVLFKEQGVPAVPALQINNTFLQKVGVHRLLVYPYIAGTLLSLSAASSEQSYCIGQYLGRMHHHAKARQSVEGLIMSHRDLNPKNVIWDFNQKPHIIDWEWAGWIDPDFEAIHTALMWSGLMAAEFHEIPYRAFLAAYATGGHRITKNIFSLLNSVDDLWMDWLMLIKDRDDAGFDKNKAIQETTSILNFIRQDLRLCL